MKVFAVIVLFFLSPALSIWPLGTTELPDYCAEYLCDGTPHIACNSTRKFAKDCPSNAKLISLTKKMKVRSMELHNRYRNKIALGSIDAYKKAARMATLVWNEELAFLAELNTKTCIFAHDQCRNTGRFLYAGQNIGQIVAKTKHIDTELVIEKVIEGWYNEYKDANMSYIESFRHAPNNVKIGHFTQLVRDESYAMGCAMSQFEKDKKYITLFACDYTLSNIDDYPIYEASEEAASGCQETNHEYPGLCSIKEIYDNELFYDMDA